jgi:hypothetical protein
VFGHALTASRCAQEVEPASKAAIEIAALWEWLARRACSRPHDEVARLSA